MRCSQCGQDKDDVATCVDPYALEVNNVRIVVDLCGKCYRIQLDDI